MILKIDLAGFCLVATTLIAGYEIVVTRYSNRPATPACWRMMTRSISTGMS